MFLGDLALASGGLQEGRGGVAGTKDAGSGWRPSWAALGLRPGRLLAAVNKASNAASK